MPIYNFDIGVHYLVIESIALWNEVVRQQHFNCLLGSAVPYSVMAILFTYSDPLSL